MKSYIIINHNSKFGHDFVQRDDEGREVFRKEITSKTTDGYYHLPAMVNGRKLCKISHIGNSEEFCIDDLGEKSVKTSSKSSVSQKIDKENPENNPLFQYLSDDIKANLIKEYNDKKLNDEKQRLLDIIKNAKARIAEIDKEVKA